MRATVKAIVILGVCIVARATLGSAPQPATSVSSPLDLRVTMDYRNRPAPEVLQTLTRAAGLTATIEPGTLLPVTTAVTNARLETALNAVCENASCRWTLQDRAVIVIPMPIDGAWLLPCGVHCSVGCVSRRGVSRPVGGAQRATVGRGCPSQRTTNQHPV